MIFNTLTFSLVLSLIASSYSVPIPVDHTYSSAFDHHPDDTASIDATMPLVNAQLGGMKSEMDEFRRSGQVPQHVVDQFGPHADYHKIADTVDKMNSHPIKFGDTDYHSGTGTLAKHNPDTDRISVSSDWHARPAHERASILVHEISHKHGTEDRFYRTTHGYVPTTNKDNDVYRPSWRHPRDRAQMIKEAPGVMHLSANAYEDWARKHPRRGAPVASGSGGRLRTNSMATPHNRPQTSSSHNRRGSLDQHRPMFPLHQQHSGQPSTSSRHALHQQHSGQPSTSSRHAPHQQHSSHLFPSPRHAPHQQHPVIPHTSVHGGGSHGYPRLRANSMSVAHQPAHGRLTTRRSSLDLTSHRNPAPVIPMMSPPKKASGWGKVKGIFSKKGKK